ncbi:hypothetical protein EYF80_013630 [Liparis tanakae]|uniref:Uncharacterized protein n=1 Tax=Liparis tanakae TaxID=230148 RepID=A0A4Z2IDD5_9TELE|nr:hypothetical protein EYF80_013630 [Liparis tanakae]
MSQEVSSGRGNAILMNRETGKLDLDKLSLCWMSKQVEGFIHYAKRTLTNKVTHSPPAAPCLDPRCRKLLEFLFRAAQILPSFLRCAAPPSQHHGLLGD